MSWNVGRLYTPTGNNRLAEADVFRVARSLRALEADVILLQEVASKAQLGRLLDLLPGYDGRVAERCGYDRHVAALARVALKPAFEQHRLEPTGRGLVAVTFELGSLRGAAHAVHLDVRQQLRKRSQVEAILAIAARRPEAVVILGGDFNTDPVWAKRLRMSVDAASFDRLAGGFDDAGRDAGPTAMRLLRVDHIFVRRPIEQPMTMRVEHRPRLPLGDHAPIVLDVLGA